MSRSYKKTPMLKDGTPASRRIQKRLANKAVRHSRYIMDGKFYRKLYNSWDIYDYVFFKPLQEAIDDWEKSLGIWGEERTRQDVKNRWARWYLRK